jgi:multiple sugar transport system permease protein
MASRRPPLAVFGFLAPNFLGFLAFTFFPILFSLWMAFTNWTLKPAVATEYLGTRNFQDLLGVRAVGGAMPALRWSYTACALAVALGLIGALWANVVQWRGTKPGGAVLLALGLGMIGSAAAGGGHHAYFIGGSLATLCGLSVVCRYEGGWRPGRGTVPAVLLAAGAIGLWQLHGPMWGSYEPRDPRFWQFFYNTVYLMLGIPFAIAGALGFALLLNERLPLGRGTARLAGALLCVVCGLLTMALVWWMGGRDLALLGGVLWGMAALGFAFNVVSFRTIFYLPRFTAGVALMILWKALYNPKTGPINHALEGLFGFLGLDAEAPSWLSSVVWAKPALMFMGVWTAIGGTNMLLYLAALSNVPRDLIDAAHVDGAGAWARFRHVIWPQLAPTTFFISIMAIIGGLQGGFEQARVMTGGGPAGSTTTLSYYIYNKAFIDLDLGYAAAISWVLFAIIFIATAINWRFGKSLEVGP